MKPLHSLARLSSPPDLGVVTAPLGAVESDEVAAPPTALVVALPQALAEPRGRDRRLRARVRLAAAGGLVMLAAMAATLLGYPGLQGQGAHQRAQRGPVASPAHAEPMALDTWLAPAVELGRELTRSAQAVAPWWLAAPKSEPAASAPEPAPADRTAADRAPAVRPAASPRVRPGQERMGVQTKDLAPLIRPDAGSR